MLTVAIDHQALERKIRDIAESEGKSKADIVREALARHFELDEGVPKASLFDLGKDLFDGAGNPAIQGEDAERLLRSMLRG